MAALSPKQEMFCKEYIIDLNATQAAIRAGYSAKSAEVQASRLLSNAKVKAYIQELFDERSKRTEITADRVLEEIAHSAFLDVSKLYNDRGEALPLSELDEATRRAIGSYGIKSVNMGNDMYAEITVAKPNDKLKSLELLGKHLKLFTDKVEHTGEISLNTIIDRLQGKK